MKTHAAIACLCLYLPAFAAPVASAQLSDNLSEGVPQNTIAAASFFNAGLAQMEAGNPTKALSNFHSASQHSISDARYWYHRFATETALGDTAAAAFSLKVASTARAKTPEREKETLVGISSIQGNLRQLIVKDFLRIRLALSSGKTATQIIATALEQRNSLTDTLNSRLVTLQQSDEVTSDPATLSNEQAIAMRMLLEQEPIAGVTEQDIASFKTATRLDNEQDATWASRLAAGLELGADEILWRWDACTENASNFQDLVPTKIVDEILQKTASQEDYKRLIESIKIEPTWVDCRQVGVPEPAPETETETETEKVDMEGIPHVEIIPACCCPCPDPCARPARRCFLRR